MRTSFITRSLATFAAVIFVGNLPLVSTANDTDEPNRLSPQKLTRISYYTCTRTFEKYAPQTFCSEMREYPPYGDGFFSLIEDQILVHSCTYEARGNPPTTKFSIPPNFLCHGANNGAAYVGQVEGNTITGQAYWLNVVGGVRSVFTCERVTTCP